MHPMEDVTNSGRAFENGWNSAYIATLTNQGAVLTRRKRSSIWNLTTLSTRTAARLAAREWGYDQLVQDGYCRLGGVLESDMLDRLRT